MTLHCVILSEAAVALCQSQMNLLLERCCMGVVYQIEDLDNSSKNLKVPTLQVISSLSCITVRIPIVKRSLDELGMTVFPLNSIIPNYINLHLLYTKR